MGRKRTKDKHLPTRVYLEHGTYWYRPRVGSAVRLGRDFTTAMRRYGELDIARPDGTTLGEIMDRFTREVAEEYARPAEIRAGIKRLRAVFGEMRPMSVRPMHVYEYMDKRCQGTEKRKGSPAGALKEKHLLSSIYKQAIRWGYVDSNPVAEVEGWKIEPRVVEDAETRRKFDQVYAVAGRQVRIVMDLARQTGLRLSDILNMQVSQLHADGIHVTVSKSRPSPRTKRKRKHAKRNIIGWSPELRETVARAKDRPVLSAYLVTNTKHRPYTVTGFESIWQAAKRRAGVKDFQFHDLRKMAANKLASDKDAARLLAHSDPRITADHYRSAPTRVQPIEWKQKKDGGE